MGLIIAVIVVVLWLIALGYLIGTGWRLANR
jgi:hypothetical protein